MSTAPTSIQIELAGLRTKLKSKTEIDIETLSTKKRLEKLSEDLKTFQIWKRTHPEEYVSLENELNHDITKIDKMLNLNKLSEMKKNLQFMEEDINEAVVSANKEKLSRLEGYLVNARLELSNFSKNPVNKEFEALIKEVDDVISVVKDKIDEFYLECIVNVEKCIERFKEITNLFQDTRYEINFTKIHRLLEVSLENLRTIDVRDRRSHITTKRREVINELEDVRSQFNNKVYGNEMIPKTEAGVENNNERVLKLIKEVEEMQRQQAGGSFVQTQDERSSSDEYDE